MRWMVALAVALAGCSGTSDPAVVDDVDDTVRGAVIEVLIGDVVQKPSNGTIAVDSDVNVTFDASQSIGAEGRYVWDFGDNQTAQGAVVEHAFGPGLFDVRLTVGANGTASGSIRVSVAQPPAPSGLPLGSEPFDFSGNLLLGNPNSPTTSGTDYRDHVVTITNATNGTAAVAQSVRISIESSGGAVDTYLYWRSPAGENLASNQASGTDKELEFEGAMPAGDYVVRVRVFLGADVDYTVTGEVSYVTP